LTLFYSFLFNYFIYFVILPSADANNVGKRFLILQEHANSLPELNKNPKDGSKKERILVTCEPVHFGQKLGSKSLLGILGYITFGIILGIFGSTSFGRWLLVKYPQVFTLGSFSKNGPYEEEVESAPFKIWFMGHGFSNESLAANGNSKPDMEVITRITRPEMGHVTTPIIMIECALVLLRKRNNLPKGQFTLLVLYLLLLICKKDFNKIEYILMLSRKASFLLHCCSSLL
jgi:hypothetical protein